MIRYVTPYALDGNLAEAMNYEMEIAPAGSYVAFVDRDTIWLDAKFGHKISEIIEEHGDAFYTCLTNRTNCEWQKYEPSYAVAGGHICGMAVIDNDNIKKHIPISLEKWLNDGFVVHDHTNSQLWSGHLMICPKNLWTPLTTKGLLGVDNEIHKHARDNGHRVLLMTGIYIYHWYSGFDGIGGHQKRDKSHLKI